jgi:hypothetical protein
MRPTFRIRVHRPLAHSRITESPIRSFGLVEAIERFIRERLVRKRERTLRK